MRAYFTEIVTRLIKVQLAAEVLLLMPGPGAES